jgi:superfamily II DNA helicase RecQ
MITCANWSTTLSLESHPQWLIVQVEHADPNHHACSRLQTYLASLHLRGRLARIVVDEAHTILTQSHFRHAMTTLQWLAGLGVNVVAMTATVPPACEKSLMESLGCPVYRVLRAPVARPNIKYSVLHAPVDPLTKLETVTHRVSLYHTEAKATLAKGEVIIVFCLSKDTCETVARMLRLPHYHADCTPEHLAETLSGLRSGKYQGVVATSLLSVGFDVPGVRHVIHHECPRNALDYEQETGRAGRDGALAHAVIFTDVEAKVKSTPFPDAFGVQAVRNMVRDDKNCRRLRMSHVLDGVGLNCPCIPGAVYCDVCAARRDDPHQVGFNPEYPSDLLTSSRLRRGETMTRSSNLC